MFMATASVDLVQIVRVVSDLGIVGLLLVILVGGAKRWWVFGWQYDAKEREAEEWKELAIKGTEMSRNAVGVAEAEKRRRAGDTG